MNKIKLHEDDDVNFFTALIDHLEDQIDYSLNFNTLTGLYNRHYFIQNFPKLVEELAVGCRDITLALIEINRFETIYKAFGHSIADRLLRKIGQWLSEWGKKRGLVIYHFDTHKFAIFLPDTQKESLEVQLTQLKEGIKGPFIEQNHKIYITTCLGACIFPNIDITPDEVIKNTELALEEGKVDNTIKINVLRLEDRLDPAYPLVKRLTIESDLFDAIHSNQFILHYQPFIDLKSGQLVSNEVLLRWYHPDHGLIYPNEFIPILEETGLIIEVGEWVIHEAACQLKQFQQMGFANLRISINLSACQLYDGTFSLSLMNILNQCGVSPDHIELEMTESMIMENAHHCWSILEELRQKGIHLALDDFGTGYSTFNILKDYPFSLLKIDQSFIVDIAENPKVNAIVSSLITMGHQLGMKVVAEGVETEQHVKILRDCGCDYAQGYFFSKPLSKEDMMNHLENNNFRKDHIF